MRRRRNPPELVERVYDTEDGVERDWHDMGGAGEMMGGFFTGWHVTDDPQGLIDKLRHGYDIASYGSDFEDLGRGLYVSGVPQYWAGRAAKKWNFLERLTTEELAKLLVALRNSQAFEQGYTTQSEQEHAARILELVAEGKYRPVVLIELANQPFNVMFWKPSFLEPLGIAPGQLPKVVEIKAKGKFAKLRRHPSEVEVERLQKEFAGAFTPSGFSTQAQTVIYKQKAIVAAREAKGVIQMNPRGRRHG